MRAALATIAMLALLSGCGQQAELEPAIGAQLPPTPYGGETTPSADEMLRLDTLAAPERSVELRRRSEVREDDPFDLPPE